LLQKQSGITKAIDPWGGSHYIEFLTRELYQRAFEHILEVEKIGGMIKAIETGLPKMRVEEAAARKQGRIDSGKDIIIGVNRNRVTQEHKLELLEVDNNVVREAQVKRLTQTKESRDNQRVLLALENLTSCARTGEGNLLECAIQAARANATLGEISTAMEQVAGRHTATIRSISGIYSKEVMKDTQFIKAQKLADVFASKEGRRPRILIAKMGQDGHDRGAKVIATSFADVGFDVDIGPLFQTPQEVATQAMENDVHLIGVSSLAGSHKTLIPDLIDALGELGRSDIKIVAGGVIPPNDHQLLLDLGVIAVFGPGTVISAAAVNILEKLLR